MCILSIRGIHRLAITIYQLLGKLDILLSAEMTLCTVNRAVKPPGPARYTDSFFKISEPVGMHLKMFFIHPFPLLNFIAGCRRRLLLSKVTKD